MSLSSHHLRISSSLATKSTFGSTESKWLATFIFQSQCVNQGHYVYLFLSNVDRKGAIELRVKKKIRPIRKKFRDGRFEIKRYRGTTLVSCFAALLAGSQDTQLSRCNVRQGRFGLFAGFTSAFGEQFGSDDRFWSHARFHRTELARKGCTESIVSPSLPVTALSICAGGFRRSSRFL